MMRRFFDPVIIPSVWQLAGNDSYLEWKREQEEAESKHSLVSWLFSIFVFLIGFMLGRV